MTGLEANWTLNKNLSKFWYLGVDSEIFWPVLDQSKLYIRSHMAIWLNRRNLCFTKEILPIPKNT